MVVGQVHTTKVLKPSSFYCYIIIIFNFSVYHMRNHVCFLCDASFLFIWLVILFLEEGMALFFHLSWPAWLYGPS